VESLAGGGGGGGGGFFNRPNSISDHSSDMVGKSLDSNQFVVVVAVLRLCGVQAFVYFLVLILKRKLPIALLGPLRECLFPVVLYTSILTPVFSSSRCESPVQLCVCYAFLKQLTFLASFSSLCIWFQASTTLLEKKWRQSSLVSDSGGRQHSWLLVLFPQLIGITCVIVHSQAELGTKSVEALKR
jgi:hypothetical protein